MERRARKGRRATSVFAVSAVVAFIVVTLNAQPVAIAAIHGYRRVVAPIAARAGFRCRFTPSCSRYAEVVIARDGVLRGGWKSLKRAARCNPLTAMGTSDKP